MASAREIRNRIRSIKNIGQITRAQEAKQRAGDCSHAGRGSTRVLGALEQPHALLEHRDRRIGETAVQKSGLFAFEPPFGLLGALVDEPLGEKHRFRRFSELRSQRAAMDELCLRRELSRFGGRRPLGHVTISLRRRGALRA